MSIEIQEQYDKIYRYCYHKVKNTVLAEDLTQETFLRYFNHNGYIERGKMLAYLYTIARNLCVDSFRKTYVEALKEDIPVSGGFDQVDLNLTVFQAIKFLSEEEQEMLLLRYVNELTVGEIASIMKISRFSVYRKTNSAIADLKKLLKKEDFYE